jgi:5S rRNA maturation endonuclease (ribonuclease M5)
MRGGFCPKMLNVQKNSPSQEEIERAGRLREVFSALSEVNQRFPVIVEGKKDANALRKLGLEGDIIILHSGKNLYDFCEDIIERFPRIVILLDWDTKGENLYKTIGKNLRGHWEEFSVFRDVIRILCQKDVKDVEGIPKLLARLDGNEYSR